jgi:predicted nucleic acid-binding protein
VKIVLDTNVLIAALIARGFTHAADDGLRRAIETLAQRRKQTDAKVPTVSEQRPLLAAVNY